MPFFYVQDERYDAVPWMAKSVYVHAALGHPAHTALAHLCASMNGAEL